MSARARSCVRARLPSLAQYCVYIYKYVRRRLVYYNIHAHTRTIRELAHKHAHAALGLIRIDQCNCRQLYIVGGAARARAPAHTRTAHTHARHRRIVDIIVRARAGYAAFSFYSAI